MPFVRELKERRIPQTLVFYLGGGWVLIEALNFFIEKYGWTAKIFDILIILFNGYIIPTDLFILPLSSYLHPFLNNPYSLNFCLSMDNVNFSLFE